MEGETGDAYNGYGRHWKSLYSSDVIPRTKREHGRYRHVEKTILKRIREYGFKTVNWFHPTECLSSTKSVEFLA
jgi:hypothetical protein